MAKRPHDLPDAPQGLPSDDPETVSPVASHEADRYGHGDDNRLISDISERYPEPSPDDQKTVAGPAKTIEFEVENEAPVLSRSGRAIYSRHTSAAATVTKLSSTRLRPA